MSDVANIKNENSEDKELVANFFITFHNLFPESEDPLTDAIEKMENHDLLGLYGSLSFIEDKDRFYLDIIRPGDNATALAASVTELNKIFPNVKIGIIEFYH